MLFMTGEGGLGDSGKKEGLFRGKKSADQPMVMVKSHLPEAGKEGEEKEGFLCSLSGAITS